MEPHEEPDRTPFLQRGLGYGTVRGFLLLMAVLFVLSAVGVGLNLWFQGTG